MLTLCCDAAALRYNARYIRAAVREVAELILKAQGKWDAIIDGYLEQGQGDQQ